MKIDKIVDELKEEIKKENNDYMNRGYRNAAYDFANSIRIFFAHVDNIDKDMIKELSDWIIDCGNDGKVNGLSEFIDYCNNDIK